MTNTSKTTALSELKRPTGHWTDYRSEEYRNFSRDYHRIRYPEGGKEKKHDYYVTVIRSKRTFERQATLLRACLI